MFFCSVRCCRCRKTRLNWPEMHRFRPQMHVVVLCIHKHRNWGWECKRGKNRHCNTAFSQICKDLEVNHHIPPSATPNKVFYTIKKLALIWCEISGRGAKRAGFGFTPLCSVTHSTDSTTPHLSAKQRTKKTLLLDIKHTKESPHLL